MMMRSILWSFTLALVVSTSLSVFAKKKEVNRGDEMEEADNLGIAERLLGDGFADRAEAVLQEVDPSDPTLDQKRFWRARGLAAMRLGKYIEAAAHLELAILQGDTAPRIYLLRAQCQAQAEQFQAAARTLERAPEGVRKFPESFILQAQVLWKLGRKNDAFLALQGGYEKFPDNRQLERQRLFLMVEMGLYQAAVEAARSLFEADKATEDDRIAVAKALAKAKQYDRAVQMLEEALLRFPESDNIRVELAATYYGLNRPTSAAEVLRPLGWVNSERAYQAAELYNKARVLTRAVQMNARVEDQKKKLKQRIGILLKRERYEELASLYPRIARLGLLEDDSIRYAIAYCFFKTKDFEHTERLLASITDADLFRKGVELRNAIETCKQAQWKCD